MRLRSFRKRKNLPGLFFCLFGVAVLAASGCSTDSNSVTGQVKLDGEPLANALVKFIPKSKQGRIALSKTDGSGNYRMVSSQSITSVAPGNYRVEITQKKPIANDGEGRSRELLPLKFNKKSTMIETVNPGANQIDFDLRSE